MGYELQYFTFEGPYKRVKTQFSTGSNISFHDCSAKLEDFDKDRSLEDIKRIIKGAKEKSIVVVDSLVHFLYIYGLGESYRFFNSIKNDEGEYDSAY